MSKELTLPSDLEATKYHEGFKEFLARTDQKQVALEWFKVHFNNRTDIKRVLSIGCGEGSFDLLLLKTLPNVHTYVGIEPNPSHVSTFQHHIENESFPSYPSMRLVQARFEEVGLSPEFDLILISQSLYYPKDKQGTLEKAFELLDVNGELIIFHTMGNRGIDQLKGQFASYQYRYMGQTLLADLEQTQLPYESEVLPSTIQLKGIPKSLVEFMLERPVSVEEYQQAKAYLHEHCPDGYLDHPLLTVRVRSALSASSYRNDYQVFRELSDTVSVVRQWAQDFLTKLDSPIKKILSIGGGNGYLDQSSFLDQLDSVCSYTSVDPNEEHLEQSRQRLAFYDHMDVKLLSQHFEYFRTDERYDLIIMSHVLYYIPERQFALSKACELLNDNGTLIVLHQTERGINALQKRYGRTRHSYNVVELAKDLDTLGIPYCYEELDSYVNLHEISAPLVRFFLEGAVSEWQADDVRQYLLRQYPEKQMHHPIGVFVISAHDFRQAIQPRLLSEAQYAECFDDFLVRSNQHAKVIDWLREQILIDRSAVQRMLSVGCGTGSFDLEFAKLLPNLRDLVLVEPNQNHLASLEKNVAATAAPFTTRIEAGTLAECDFDEHFDLILFAHSLYYVKDILDILKQAASILSERGQLLLLHEPQYGGMHQLHKRVGFFGRISLTARHLEDYLIKLGLEFKIDIVPVSLDLRQLSDRIIHFLLERNPTKAEDIEARACLLDMAPHGFLTQDTVALIVQPKDAMTPHQPIY